MKFTRIALAAAACCGLVATGAQAQQLHQPGSMQPVALTYDYYAQDTVTPSPSDLATAETSNLTYAKDASQKDGKDCGCDAKGGKGAKGGKSRGCSCYLWGPDEAWSLYNGDNRFGIDVGGWTQFGYHNRNSGDGVNPADGFNQNQDGFNLHQQWFWMERVADGSCGWDWGFRADIMYGIDANNTQAFGNNPGVWDFMNGLDYGAYGWAIPQLYAEIANGDLSVKLGHFFTYIGYEVVTAPDNFFYSHAFTMNNSEPFTHTGAIATYNYSDRLTVYGGWTAGWDTGFDQFVDGSNFLGGFGYALTDDIQFTYMTTAGDFGWLGVGNRDSYSHSIVFDIALTDRLNYVLQSDVVDAGVYDTVGINQYLFYTLNDCVALGGRVEWWKFNGQSINAATFGLNYRPHANLVLRPEVKQEWTPGAGFDQTIFGMDMIVTY